MRHLHTIYLFILLRHGNIEIKALEPLEHYMEYNAWKCEKTTSLLSFKDNLEMV